jgi:hypothetical protein
MRPSSIQPAVVFFFHFPNFMSWCLCLSRGNHAGYLEVKFFLSLFNKIFFFFFCGTGAWSQEIHLKPLHQPYFCEGFFKTASCRTICLDCLWAMILLISASWVARITGIRHKHPALFSKILIQFCSCPSFSAWREKTVLQSYFSVIWCLTLLSYSLTLP